MPDTKRTSTDLTTNLFQDGQANSAITAQDVRDFIVSQVQPWANAYMEGNVTETSIGTQSVYEAIAGTFSTNGSTEFTVSSAGLLTYTGTPNRHFHIVSNLSLTSAGNNKTYRIAWHKNGSTRIEAYVDRKISTGADVGAMSIHADVSLSTNDTLQLKIANETDTTNATVTSCYLFVSGMFI